MDGKQVPKIALIPMAGAEEDEDIVPGLERLAALLLPKIDELELVRPPGSSRPRPPLPPVLLFVKVERCPLPRFNVLEWPETLVLITGGSFAFANTTLPSCENCGVLRNEL